MRNNVLIFIYNLTSNYITLNSLDVLLGRKLVFEEESFGESFWDHTLSPLPLLSTLNVCVDLSQHPPSACANLVNLGPAYSCFRFALHTACILLVHHLQLPPALWEVKVWVQIQGRPGRSRSTMNTRDTNMCCVIHTLDMSCQIHTLDMSCQIHTLDMSCVIHTLDMCCQPLLMHHGHIV